MWQGIKLASDWGYVNVIGGSLIEDANRAISAINLVPDGGTSQYILTSDAVFNRNHEAIHIENYPYAGADNHFRFVNTVFTSRELATDFATWPHPFTLIYGTLPSGYGPLLPPYHLNANYVKAATRDGLPAYMGIRASNVGITTGTAPAYVYKGLNVGANADGIRNLFDNMRCGIESYNTSVYVKNSSFTEMFTVFEQGKGFGGYGIYDWNAPYGGGSPRQFQALSSPPVAGAPNVRNEFYNNPVGIEAAHNYQASVENALIRTSNTNLTINDLGQIGIRLESANFGLMRADYNIIENCVNGIFLADWGGAGNKGYEIATYNNISATLGAAYSNQNTAIHVDGSGGPASTYTAQIEHNTITNMYNGIGINNFWSRTPYINNNTVVLQTANPGQAQYGIVSNFCELPQIHYNNVSSYSSSNDNARDYYISQNVFPKIGCNTASNTGRGFEFVGMQPGTFWHTNTMSNNGKGFVLDGIIGAQGTSSQGHGNRWLGASTGVWTGPGNYQTYCVNGAIPSNSALYVLNGVSFEEDPTNNGADLLSVPYAHGTLNPSLFYVSSSLRSAVCPAAPKPPSYYRLALEKVVQDSIQYGGEQGLHAWMAQLATYQELVRDSTLADSSAVLQSFVNATVGSRFQWLTQMDSAINSGNILLSNALLASVPSASGNIYGSNATVVLDTYEGDGVVANYVQYYTLLSAFRDTLMTGIDTAALVSLANLCPRMDGAVIYQARALLRLLSNDIVVYEDDCTDGAGEYSRGPQEQHNERIIKDALGQGYIVMPNPTTGNIQLKQLVTDKERVDIKIYNSFGAVVWEGYKYFSNKQSSLQLSFLIPGLYNLMLTDSKGFKTSIHLTKL